MMKINKEILILIILISASNMLKAQNDTVWVNVAQIDTLKEVKQRNKKSEAEKEKQKLYELKQDIERQNSNTSKKKVYIVDTVYIKKEKRVLGKPPRFYKHEVGVETGAFFNQIFRVFGLVRDTQNFPVSPYVISYKYRTNEKGAARIGVGARTYKLTENRGAFADTKTFTNQFYDLRLGYEFNIPLDDRWLSYVGIDGTFGFNKENTEFDSGFDRNIRKIQSNAYGLAFVLGIRYDFSWRVSLGSEMGFGFINRESQETNEFTANPQFNSIVRKSSEQLTKFNGPGNVYISIRF
jgi:opacity protein-like surface antigen